MGDQSNQEEKQTPSKHYTPEELHEIYCGYKAPVIHSSQANYVQFHQTSYSNLTSLTTHRPSEKDHQRTRQTEKDYLKKKTFHEHQKNTNLQCGKNNPNKKRGPLLPTPRRTLIEPVKELKPLLPELQNSTFTHSHFMLIKAIKLGIKQNKLLK